MAYIEHNRIGGESVLFHARLHSIALLKHILFVLVMIAAAIALWYFATRAPSTDNADLMKKISYILISLSLIPIVARTIGRFGAVQRKTEEVFLNKIESNGVDQTIPGRIAEPAVPSNRFSLSPRQWY